jgi:hypothetical protein
MKVRHVLPFVLFPVLILSLVALGVAAYLRRPRQITPELVAIPSEDIPAAVREVVAGRRFAEDWVWRACYEQDGYLVAVRTVERRMVAGQY